MIAPFREESLNNKLSDMKYNTVESRFLEPSVSRTSRYLEPNHVAIEFASLIRHTVVSPPISRTRDFSKLPKLEPIFFLFFFERFEYHMCINIVFRWQMLANHSTRLKVNNNILRCQTTYRRLFENLNFVPMATTDRDMLGLFCEST